jgi:four helix bundle protein
VIRSYRDLPVWQRSMDLVVLIRMASISVPCNIDEGYGRQSSGNYKQFLIYLQDADC